MNKKKHMSIKTSYMSIKNYSKHVIVSPFRGYGLLFQQHSFSRLLWQSLVESGQVVLTEEVKT